MEQMYLIEIFVDTVCVFVREDDPRSSIKDKRLMVLIKFGPDIQFIVKEALMAKTPRRDADFAEDENVYKYKNNKKWCRTFRVGKSYLFPSYAATMFSILEKYPLQIEVWTDDENEKKEMIGHGSMMFDTRFFVFLKETYNNCEEYDIEKRTRSIKEISTLWLECCCVEAGEIGFIFRLSAIGDSITTDFQQLFEKDPNAFVFKTDKAPSMFQITRIERDNPKYNTADSLYDQAIAADPDVKEKLNRTIQVCTELQSCGVTRGEVCQPQPVPKVERQYPITKVRMGDITGPCGNINCPLAHKIKTYIRNLEVYKKKTADLQFGSKAVANTKDICGQCGCRHSKFYRDWTFTADKSEKSPVCIGCGGVAQTNETCADRLRKLHGTGFTPTGSKTNLK